MNEADTAETASRQVEDVADEAVRQVAHTVRQLNRTWLEGKVEDLARFFDPDVTLAAPGFAQRLVGRDAVLDSYRDFLEQATLHHFEMLEPNIHVVGGTAIATCPYETEYSVGGQRWKGDGHDVLVLLEKDGAWRVIWRHLAAGPEEEVAR
jgi:uncharacterized protein (TIGR02246 family)